MELPVGQLDFWCDRLQEAQPNLQIVVAKNCLTTFQTMAAEITKEKGKLGRQENPRDDELLRRYQGLKVFFEDCWGRIGLPLQKARNSQAVRDAFKIIPQIEYCLPFRGHAICLIAGDPIETTAKETAGTRRQYEAAKTKEDAAWFQYQNMLPSASQAVTALNTVMQDFRYAIHTLPFFFVASAASKELGVEELTSKYKLLEASAHQVKKERESLEKRLRSQEAWYAQNEVIKFVMNDRVSKNPQNFARALAGLPELGWIQSHRRCKNIRDDQFVAFPYQLFQLVQEIVRKTNPPRISRIEQKLRNKLLNLDANSGLRSYIAPHWFFMTRALAESQPSEDNRIELPYKIMDRFLDYLGRPKNMVTVGIAKRNELF